MITVKDGITIQGPLGEVYHSFWNASLWPQLTPHVPRVEVLEEGPGHQRLSMEVIAGGKRYTVETVREGIPDVSITYSQTRPPPAFAVHTGLWTFDDSPEGVHVTLEHRVWLNEEKAIASLGVATAYDAECRVRAMLSRNALTTMECVKAHVERQNNGDQASE